MKHKINAHQMLGIINKMCMAYFENILENEGVLLQDMIPTCAPHLHMMDCYFPDENSHQYPHCNGFAHPVLVFHVKDDSPTETELQLEDYFDKYFREEVEKIAKTTAQHIKAFPLQDILFSAIPLTGEPFISLRDKDPETELVFKATWGSSLGVSKNTIVIEFAYLLVDKMGMIKSDNPMYPAMIMPVKLMTPDQLKDYQSQLEKELP